MRAWAADVTAVGGSCVVLPAADAPRFAFCCPAVGKELTPDTETPDAADTR